MSTKTHIDLEDTELPRKKAKVDGEAHHNGVELQQRSSNAEQPSEEKHGEEANTNPQETSATSDSTTTAKTDTSDSSHKDLDNNNITNQPSTSDSSTSDNNNNSNDTTTTTPSEASGSNVPYDKNNVIWEGNLISEKSWPTIPHFENWRLLDASDGDKTFEKDLIDVFRETCEGRVGELEAAFQAENEEDSILLSHDLKGSSSNIGAELIRLVSEKMEMLCRHKKYQEALGCIDQLKRAIADTNKTFDEYFADVQ